jgi:hypothetical protein
MYNSNSYGDPPSQNSGSLQEVHRRLAALDVENTRLRQQIFDAAQKNEDQQLCFSSSEAELKYTIKKEAEKFEKELGIRVRYDSSMIFNLHSFNAPLI